MGLVSAATVRAYLPEITGSGADSELTLMLARVESALARYLDFPVADSGTTPVLDQQTYTIYLDGPMYDDPSVLASPLRPLVSVTSVHSDPNLVYDSSTEIGASEYVIDKSLGRLVLLPLSSTSSFDRGFRNIKLVCVAGYSASNPPADLVHAICVWCSQLQRGKANQGKDSITVRDSTIKISRRTIPEEVKQLIQPLRNYGSIL